MITDKIISQWFLENVSSDLTFAQIAKFLSEITSWGQLWIGIMVVYIIYEVVKEKKFNPYFIFVLIPVLLGWLFCDEVVKPAVGRLRPYQEMEGFSQIIETIGYKYPKSASFPSGHTITAFASAFLITCKNKKLAPYAYILASLVGVSRIVLGAHYFSDVLAGIGIGTLIGILSDLFAKGCEKLVVLIKNKFFNKDSNNEA